MENARSPEREGAHKTWGRWTREGNVKRHVIRVRREDGLLGVLKVPQHTDQASRSRFTNEARNMARLSKINEGIVPVLDIDPTDPPGWYVMPVCDPVRKYLGATPDLWLVVDTVRAITATLIALEVAETSHRDIKPDNIVVLDGVPRLIDFELATWPDREPLTRDGGKVGPAVFLAPEMRSFNQSSDSTKADVYSLAKTLFSLARPGDGPYPPDGHHAIGDSEFSLYWQGGTASGDLERVLDLATQHRPDRRPTLTRFHDELRGWLELYPRYSVAIPKRGRFRTMGEPESVASLRRAEAQIDHLRTMMTRCCQDISKSLGFIVSLDTARFSDLLSSHDLPNAELDSHALIGSNYGFTRRRFILGFAVVGDEVTLILEIHEQPGVLVFTERAECRLEDVTCPRLALRKFSDVARAAMRG